MTTKSTQAAFEIVKSTLKRAGRRGFLGESVFSRGVCLPAKIQKDDPLRYINVAVPQALSLVRFGVAVASI
jgi:hypothetical protein